MDEHHDEPQPDTLGVKTARGWHLYFVYPVDIRIPSSTGDTGGIGDGLDIRGAGGYAMVPPSTHPDGPAYEWLGEDKTIAPPPKWLLAAVQQANGRGTA